MSDLKDKRQDYTAESAGRVAILSAKKAGPPDCSDYNQEDELASLNLKFSRKKARRALNPVFLKDTPSLADRQEEEEAQTLIRKGRKELRNLKKDFEKQKVLLKAKTEKLNKIIDIFGIETNSTPMILESDKIKDDGTFTLSREDLLKLKKECEDKIRQEYAQRKAKSRQTMKVICLNSDNKDSNCITLQLKKDPKIPEFKGTAEEVANYEAALDNLRKQLISNGEEDPDEWILSRMSDSLKGDTHIWFRDLWQRRDPPPPTTIKEYIQEVKNFFIGHVPRTDRLEGLRSVRQTLKESIQIYAQRFDTKRRQLGLPRTDEGAKIEFIKGIRDKSTATEVAKWYNSPRNASPEWQQLVDMAVKKSAQSATSLLKDTNFTQAAPILESEGQEIKEMLRKIQKELAECKEGRAKETNNKHPPCPYCKKTNHKAEKCFYKPKEEGKGSKRDREEKEKEKEDSNKRPKRDLSSIKCFKCQKMGHYANQCKGSKEKKEESEDFKEALKQMLKLKEDLAVMLEKNNKTSSSYLDPILSEKEQKDSKGYKLIKKTLPHKAKTRRLHTKLKEVKDKPKEVEKKQDEKGKEKETLANTIGAAELGGEISPKSKDAEREKKWTAAFTMLTVKSRNIRALIDTGASHSVIALSWLKYLQMDHLIQKAEVHMVDAQKVAIPILGTVTIPVDFGNKTFEWDFKVAETLICPMIIGMNVLHEAVVKMKNRKVKIQDQAIPICITLEELQQHAIVSTVNKKLPPQSITKIEGRIIKNDIWEEDPPKQYIVNSNSTVLNDQLVESYTRNKVECVTFMLVNETSMRLEVRKGDILAFAQDLSEEQVSGISAISQEIAVQNLTELVSSLSTVNDSEIKSSDISQANSPDRALNKQNHSPGEKALLNAQEKHKGVTSDSEESLVRGNPECVCKGLEKDLNSIKIANTRAETRRDNNSSLQSYSAVPAEGSKLIYVEPSESTTCESSPKTVLAVEMGSPLASNKGVETLGPRSTSLSTGSRRIPHEITSGAVSESVAEAQYYESQKLATWLESPQVLPINKDGPILQRSDDEDTQNYIKTSLDKDKRPESQQKEITDEQIEELVKDSPITEEQKKRLAQLLKKFESQLSTGFTNIKPAGSSFFIPHKIKLSHKDPVWTPQFRRPKKEDDMLNEQALLMYKQGVIERTTTSEFNSPAYGSSQERWRMENCYRL